MSIPLTWRPCNTRSSTINVSCLIRRVVIDKKDHSQHHLICVKADLNIIFLTLLCHDAQYYHECCKAVLTECDYLVSRFRVRSDHQMRLTRASIVTSQSQLSSHLTIMSGHPFIILLTCLLSLHSVSGLVYRPPLCSIEGLKIGAGLGSVAGAVGGEVK